MPPLEDYLNTRTFFSDGLVVFIADPLSSGFRFEYSQVFGHV